MNKLLMLSLLIFGTSNAYATDKYIVGDCVNMPIFESDAKNQLSSDAISLGQFRIMAVVTTDGKRFYKAKVFKNWEFMDQVFIESTEDPQYLIPVDHLDSWKAASHFWFSNDAYDPLGCNPQQISPLTSK